jgi:hypothetical protein
MLKKEKIYCYVDETGQDAGSDIFVVVAVIVADNLNAVREQLIEIEKIGKIGSTKWHKLRHKDRIQFLSAILDIKNVEFKIYFGQYKKIVPFFLPLIETIYRSIKNFTVRDSQAIVCVDGIDNKKSTELTLILRSKGIKLKYVRTARDESEPLIRLADRWAGCIRLRIKGHQPYIDLVSEALRKGLLSRI